MMLDYLEISTESSSIDGVNLFTLGVQQDNISFAHQYERTSFLSEGLNFLESDQQMSQTTQLTPSGIRSSRVDDNSDTDRGCCTALSEPLQNYFEDALEKSRIEPALINDHRSSMLSSEMDPASAASTFWGDSGNAGMVWIDCRTTSAPSDDDIGHGGGAFSAKGSVTVPSKWNGARAATLNHWNDSGQTGTEGLPAVIETSQQ